MTTQTLITLLLIAAGAIGAGILILGIQGHVRKEGTGESPLRGPIGGWFLIAVGGILLILAAILGIWHPGTAGTNILPPSSLASPTPAADRPTFPPRPTIVLFTPTPTPTPVPTPVLSSDWSFRERPAHGFAIALPSTWAEIDLDAETMDDALAAIRECCPDMDLSLWSEQTVESLRAKGMLLYAIDPSSDPEAVYYGFLSVTRTSLGVGWTLDMALEVVLDEYENSGTDFTHRRVTLPAGEAEVIQFTEEGLRPVQTTKYLLVQTDAFWFITMGCEAEFTEDYARIFETIPQTFYWIE